jgi:hypothetical protein
MQQFDRFEAVVNLRSGGEFVPRIDVLKWNGRRILVSAVYELEDRAPYNRGEFACIVEDGKNERFPRAWIASGDLQVI